MPGPLSGVIVLDFTQLLQGPYATQMLGDMGAEIIKIEPPGGDWMRKFALSNLYLGGESVSFLAFNRNKRSLTLNLKQPGGVEVVKRLAARADIVIENFRPGVMERLGIGYDTLAAINPRLIFCSSSGFGQTGPYVERPGQDLLVQAMTGLPYLNGRDEDVPVAVGLGIADIAAALHIVYGVLAALYSRERTGHGQRVEVCLYNSLLAFVHQELSTYLNGGGLPQRSHSGNNPAPYNGAPYGLYPTSDGYIAIAMNPVNKLAALLGLSGYEHLTSNNVLDNRDDINRALASAFCQRPTQEWLALLLAEDIWCAPVYTFADVERDPQVAANEMIVSYDHARAGTVRTLGIPVKFGGTPGAISRPAPLLGEHSAELLREFGGYSDADIQDLQAQSVIL
ncbi:MAG: CoA transferase [Chloroflexi bacterium]|nr:CoA transferase [Chloroflexota bacterium]